MSLMSGVLISRTVALCLCLLLNAYCRSVPVSASGNIYCPSGATPKSVWVRLREADSGPNSIDPNDAATYPQNRFRYAGGGSYFTVQGEVVDGAFGGDPEPYLMLCAFCPAGKLCENYGFPCGQFYLSGLNTVADGVPDSPICG
ncbi:hypothetical protein AAVH_27028 [Aphelenchoides avenae]|nr:hypothetical protein AAVH_27028 [Aphelenchus avenae]